MYISCDELEEKLTRIANMSNDDRREWWKTIYIREEARGDQAWNDHVPELASEKDEFALSVLEELFDDGDLDATIDDHFWKVRKIDKQHDTLEELHIKRGSAEDRELRIMLQNILDLALANGAEPAYPIQGMISINLGDT